MADPSRLAAFVASHPATSPEVKELCKDLQVWLVVVFVCECVRVRVCCGWGGGGHIAGQAGTGAALGCLFICFCRSGTCGGGPGGSRQTTPTARSPTC